ncbi:protein tantalus [Drosophila sulfurigaster albostrigata]|uniref:protein tantalus n=1 Tax=Drosophila sulfurigaster albostrigata TaxID=89887 RepID=UPI002D21CAEC|nr:protein tantalus [Drosophila sulfurigaster albostrigata]
MENIVHNFAKISFQPKEVVLTENRSAPNNFTWNFKPMPGHTVSSPPDAMLESESGDTDQSDEIDSQLSRGEDNDESDSSSSCCSQRGQQRGGVSRRRMPARIAKDNFNRVCSAIMKPAKKKRRETLHTNEQTLKSIEKIYTSKRMKKFTPANLETIFEEPSDENAADAEDDSEECGAITSQVRLVKFGSRKLRRAISFNDGLHKNKNLIKKRRLKVKKTFGKRFALKKISMTEFHDRLNKSLDSAMFEEEEQEDVDVDGASGSKTATAASGSAAAITFMDDMQLPPLSTPSAVFE